MITKISLLKHLKVKHVWNVVKAMEDVFRKPILTLIIVTLVEKKYDVVTMVNYYNLYYSKT